MFLANFKHTQDSQVLFFTTLHSILECKKTIYDLTNHVDVYQRMSKRSYSVNNPDGFSAQWCDRKLYKTETALNVAEEDLKRLLSTLGSLIDYMEQEVA